MSTPSYPTPNTETIFKFLKLDKNLLLVLKPPVTTIPVYLL